MLEKIEGIVLTEQDYGETSKILNVITKEYGIIGVISKGCRSMKSKLRSVSSKLTFGEFNLYYKKDKLSILTSVDVINPFNEIKKDISKISYASYILDLAGQVSKESYNSDVYNLLISSLEKINDGFDPLVITNILELKYLNYLGVMPVLDACCLCDTTVGIETISPHRGGYICGNCFTNERKVSARTIKMVRMYYYVDINKISKLDISEDVKKEINNFLDEYYDNYTGLYLKTKEFIQNLNKIS